MNDLTRRRSVVIMGLPGSGKTTYLAALWHLVNDHTCALALRFRDLAVGDMSHLHAIAKVWRRGVIQERTRTSGQRMVRMNLLDAQDQPLHLTFPDTPGESFEEMWATRECDVSTAEILEADGVVLVVHGDRVSKALPIVEVAAQSAELKVPFEPGEPVDWRPELSPTQVQLVSLLQSLREAPLDIGPRRLAIVVSAWDKVSADYDEPAPFLERELPLLDQYLKNRADGWTWRVYGMSAQGGDYDDGKSEQPSQGVEKLLELDNPSQRILLVHDGKKSNDLTLPIAWLISRPGGES